MFYYDIDSELYDIQESAFSQECSVSKTRSCESVVTSVNFCDNKMKRVQTIELQTIQDSRELYYLLTGLSYTKIGIKFYGRQKYKFVYRIRKLMKQFNLTNRRQLAYFAVKNHLVALDKIKDFDYA